MNISLWFKAFSLGLLAALPSVGLSLYIGSSWRESDHAYGQLVEGFKPHASSIIASPHQRRGIVKQIWFRPLEEASSLYLQAEHSELLVETVEGQTKAREHLHRVIAGFQDRSFHGKSTSGKSISSKAARNDLWSLRMLRANSAIFDYTHQMLEANRVGLEVYQLPQPIDLASQLPPNPEIATIAGLAERISLDCRSKPPRFKALRFRAYINPKPSTLSDQPLSAPP